MNSLDSEGGKEKGTVFHIKIFNTVISADKAPNEIDDVARGPDASHSGALDGKSADSLPIRRAQSSIFRVTGGLTYDQIYFTPNSMWLNLIS